MPPGWGVQDLSNTEDTLGHIQDTLETLYLWNVLVFCWKSWRRRRPRDGGLSISSWMDWMMDGVTKWRMEWQASLYASCRVMDRSLWCDLNTCWWYWCGGLVHSRGLRRNTEKGAQDTTLWSSRVKRQRQEWKSSSRTAWGTPGSGGWIQVTRCCTKSADANLYSPVGWSGINLNKHSCCVWLYL